MQAFLGLSGRAGRDGAASWITMDPVGNGGMCYQDSIELAELYQPIKVRMRRFVEDSEGAGAYVGAPSVHVEFEADGAPIEIGYVSDGFVNPPLGARGGLNGAGSQQLRRRTDTTIEVLPACAQVTLAPGETIISISCGGGGYGPPRERAPERVKRDVTERWITAERARSVYGVDISE